MTTPAPTDSHRTAPRHLTVPHSVSVYVLWWYRQAAWHAMSLLADDNVLATTGTAIADHGIGHGPAAAAVHSRDILLDGGARRRQ
jgi:hypothetical protein